MLITQGRVLKAICAAPWDDTELQQAVIFKLEPVILKQTLLFLCERGPVSSQCIHDCALCAPMVNHSVRGLGGHACSPLLFSACVLPFQLCELIK